MDAILTKVIREANGMPHRTGEHVSIEGKWYEMGTHRHVLIARWPDGHKSVLLPDDVQMGANVAAIS